MRFYIGNSSIFDTPPYYQKEKIAKFVRQAGGMNVRLARCYGWSNQPQVVCFDASSTTVADYIAKRVAEDLGGRFKTWGVFARKKDW